MGRVLQSTAAVAAASLAAIVALPPSAGAAQLIGRDVQGLRLEVDGKGEALLLFRSDGQRWHVLVWGAENALPRNAAKPQVKFQVDYSGGWGKYRHRLFGGKVYWQVFENRCRAYSGPALPDLVAACDAPDGSHWAVQQWPEPLPDLGFAPWKPQQRQQWAEVSHWSGPVAKLTAYADWVYDGYHHLFGNYTYDDQPVYGFGTTRNGVPTDGYGRLVFLDTYDSAYGAGWRRENSFVTQGPTGAWCYGFFQHDPTKGGYQYPPGQTAPRPSGNGTQYRLLAEGPGVTPDVAATVADPGDWDASDPAKVAFLQQELQLLPAVVGADAKCRLGHDIGVDSAPIDTAPPQLSAPTLAAGATIEADTGSWLVAPAGFTFQWYRCDQTGAACRPIPGARAQTYTISPGDVGATLYAEITARNAHGNKTTLDTSRTQAIGGG